MFIKILEWTRTAWAACPPPFPDCNRTWGKEAEEVVVKVRYTWALVLALSLHISLSFLPVKWVQ